MRLIRRVTLLICLLALASAGAWANDADRAQLLSGVKTVAAIGLPGSVAVYGPDAFAVVAGKAPGALEGYNVTAPVVAAARGGRTRIVAFGHDGYFSDPKALPGDTAQLLVNSVTWAAAGRAAPRVGVVRLPAMVDFLNARRINARAVDLSLDFSAYDAYDVLVLTHAGVTPELAERVRAFALRGGGLLMASAGWGWQSITGQPINRHPLNLITAGTGLAWTPDTVAATTDTGGFYAEGGLFPYINAAEALAALIDSEKRNRAFPIPFYAPQAQASVLLALRSMGPSDPILAGMQKELRPLIGGDRVVPSPAKPVPVSDPGARIAVALDLRRYDLGLEPVTNAHPAAALFPGAVPANAQRVSRGVAFDGAIKGWHSTGLYCPPGGLVTVHLSNNAVGKGLGVRIGAHTDDLWHLDNWERAPALSNRVGPVVGDSVLVGSAFGGPLYIEVPENQALGAFSVAFVGAVEAPYFKLGTTTPTDWRNTIRSRPGPWAELAGKRVILTVPSSAIRNLADPTPLVKFWDAIDEAEDILAGRPADPNERPERMVADQQISLGYMHSGYPIMTHLDVVDLVVDEPRLRREGSWGHFHELGHNHQSDAWTFDGTVEVTCNLFTLYAYQAVVGGPIASGIPDIGLRDPAKRLAKISAHVKSGSPYAKWKADSFLSLLMYIQMVEGFGWAPFQKVFIEYRGLPAAQLPKTDDQKRDQWLVRFSRAVGKNLGPFFQTWGVPTSDAARASIQNLPQWMPANMPTR